MSVNDNPHIPTKELILERMRLISEAVLSRQFLENARFEVVDYQLKEFLLRVEAEIMAERKQDTVMVTVEFEIPSTWWQMFKMEVMPEWFLQKWPIKYKKQYKQKTESVEWVIPNKEYIFDRNTSMQKIIFPKTYAKIKKQ